MSLSRSSRKSPTPQQSTRSRAHTPTNSILRQPSYSESKPEFRVYRSNSSKFEKFQANQNENQPPFHTEGDSIKVESPEFAKQWSLNPNPHDYSQKLGETSRRGTPEPSMAQPLTDYNISMSSFHPQMQEDIEAPPFGVLGLEDNPELTQMLRILEARFGKLEKRLETNENLVHLHDEMERLNQAETRNTNLHEENAVKEINMRMEALDRKMELFREGLGTHQEDIGQKLDGFTRKIEDYLGRFTMTTAQLGEKFDMLISEKDKETSLAQEKITGVETRLDNVVEDVKERLKVLYDTVEALGKLVHKTSDTLENEKYNVRKLEDDFLSLLSTAKDVSQSSGEVKWLNEELGRLKSREKGILNYLNFGRVADPSGRYSVSYMEDKY